MISFSKICEECQKFEIENGFRIKTIVLPNIDYYSLLEDQKALRKYDLSYKSTDGESSIKFHYAENKCVKVIPEHEENK